MSKLTNWLLNQSPDNVKQLSIVKGADFLHISSDGKLKPMTPRIGRRQMKDEDRTIPRICGAPHLLGCIYGHSAVHVGVMAESSFDGEDWSLDDGSFHIYKIDGDEFISPAKKLVPDVKLTDEIWVVPCSPEYSKATPRKIGRFIPVTVSHSIHLNRTELLNHFYVEVKEPFRLYDDVLQAGYYSFKIEGDLQPFNGVEKPFEVKQISTSEWREALTTFIKEFKKKLPPKK